MRLIYFVLCLTYAISICGQSVSLSSQDSILSKEWVEEVDLHATLYTGKEQIKYPVFYENHPFYIQKEPLISFLSYDGTDYPSAGLRWDTYKDEVMVVSVDQRFNILLVPQRLSEARLSENSLYYIDANMTRGISKSGYFLNLYRNKNNVWVKPVAALNNKHEDQRIIYYFTFKKHYYIQKENTFYPVKNLSGIYRVFADKKRELKQYAKKKKLNFNSSPEQIIPIMVREYERLTQTEKQ